MKLISWNVNSLNARYLSVEELIKDHQPDILLIQESRISESVYESQWKDWDSELGYASLLNSKESYPGRAGVLSLIKDTIKVSEVDLDHLNSSGRIQSFEIGGITLINVYINQGQEYLSEEYVDKLALMEELRVMVDNLLNSGKEVIIGGDFNICPEDIHVWSTSNWHSGVVSRTPEEIDSFNGIIDLGLTNIEPTEGELMTWYGYRHSWRKMDEGVRVDLSSKYGIKCDHFLLSNGLSGSVTIDPKFRFEVDKPSDHLPVVLTLA